MKKQLLTLSKEVDSLIEASKHFKLEDGDYFYAVKELARRKAILDQPLTLSQFIPCDSEGKPLEKPRYYDVWDKENNTLTDDATILSLHKYKQALKAVIFEGWKIDSVGEFGIILKLDKMELCIYDFGEYTTIQFCNITKPNGESIRPKTISDLANATQDNPINLR